MGKTKGNENNKQFSNTEIQRVEVVSWYSTEVKCMSSTGRAGQELT
jgi:hypothetical protein